MARYVKRPATIDAEHVDVLIMLSRDNWQMLPIWFKEAYNKGGVVITSEGIHVKTNHGVVFADKEDYIIKNELGEVYPCNAETFENNYLKL